VLYAEPNRGGRVAWDEGSSLSGAPNGRMAWAFASRDDVVPIEDDQYLTALDRMFDLDLCLVTGPVNDFPTEQVEFWAYFVKKPGA
jgi:hypothetical protein